MWIQFIIEVSNSEIYCFTIIEMNLISEHISARNERLWRTGNWKWNEKKNNKQKISRFAVDSMWFRRFFPILR